MQATGYTAVYMCDFKLVLRCLEKYLTSLFSFHILLIKIITATHLHSSEFISELFLYEYSVV